MTALVNWLTGGPTPPRRRRFDCPKPVLIADNVVATHLFRIAQEAGKRPFDTGGPADHAGASDNGTLHLQVQNDGRILAPRRQVSQVSACRS